MLNSEECRRTGETADALKNGLIIIGAAVFIYEISKIICQSPFKNLVKIWTHR